MELDVGTHKSLPMMIAVIANFCLTLHEENVNNWKNILKYMQKDM